MSEPVLLSRSIGFRARLEARVSWLLEPVKRELAASMLPLFIASLTTERLVEPIERHVTRLTRALVEGKAMQQAVLDRAWLAENWSLSDCDTSDPDLEAALAEAALFEQRAAPGLAEQRLAR